MRFRSRVLVGAVVAGATLSLLAVRGYPGRDWFHFLVYLAAILLSSGMKVGMPKRDGTMSVNFPFILLGIVQLSPAQSAALAVASVIALCRVRVIKQFTVVQILFNVANVATATVLAWAAYAGSLHLLRGEVAPALAIGVTVYFVANTAPLGLILAWETGAPFLKEWRQDFPWYFPFYLAGAMVAALTNFVSIKVGWLTSLLLIPVVYIVYRAYSAQMAIIRDRERHLIETEALHLRTMEGLAMAVEAKDENTHRHLMRVRVYVSELGRITGLDDAEMKALVTAAYLHDIGKLAIPEHILNKPGRLTPREFEKMKIHPVVGAQILERVRFPYPVVPIVRAHHEAWDGSGYPDGLKGEAIPIGARILTAVDCFDALASDRPYRNAIPLDEALAMVKSRAGIQFDPAVVGLLEEHYRRLEALAQSQMHQMDPLVTNLFIERGAAPGAGFEQDGHGHGGPGPGSGGPSSGGPRCGDGVAGEGAAGVGLNPAKKAAEEAQAILDLTRTQAGSPGSRQAAAMMSARLGGLVPFDCFAVYLRSGDFVQAHYLGGDCAPAFSAIPIPLGVGVSGWATQNDRSILNGNPAVEPNFVRENGLLTGAGSALAVPLIDSSGATFAVLTLYCREPDAFSKDHLRIVEAVQSGFSMALENALKFETPGVLEGSALS